jgi:hypothetical protein
MTITINGHSLFDAWLTFVMWCWIVGGPIVLVLLAWIAVLTLTRRRP